MVSAEDAESEASDSETSNAAEITVIEATAVGDGTSDSPLQIYTEDLLLEFAKRVEAGGETPLYANLAADLFFEE